MKLWYNRPAQDWLEALPLGNSLIYEVGSLKAETVAALQNEDFHLEKVSFRPTAENFAYYFYKKLTELGYGVHCVEVYETPNNCAVYEEE